MLHFEHRKAKRFRRKYQLKEFKMLSNRLLNLFVVISLVAVAALLVREASATAAVVPNMDLW